MSTTIRCGADLVEIRRISNAITRLGQPFLDRVWTAAEQADCLRSGPLTVVAAASLAARFAAKEAAAKALGTGIGREGVCWTDLVVARLESGAPDMRLEGAAGDVFRRLGGKSVTISLSHERDMALAFCIMTCEVENSDT